MDKTETKNYINNENNLVRICAQFKHVEQNNFMKSSIQLTKNIG
jgi:hypothetical protein